MKICNSSSKRIFLIAALLIGAFAAGRLLRPVQSDRQNADADIHAHTAHEADETWTCSMHPQIQVPTPGKCPICFMDLIPLEGDDSTGDDSARKLTISDASARLLDLQTVPAQRRAVTVEIRMSGQVDYDETRRSDITAWVPGRIDRLFVDYTGIPVRKGDHMVELYSPELLSAQQEFIQAMNTSESMPTGNSAITEAAREKLRLLGLSAEQITRIEANKRASEHVVINAPASGIVIHRYAQQGMYVNTGTRIYTIADLSRVWVRLNAYESDLIWLRYGQEVTFTTKAYPGDVFTGHIAFIDPVVNPDSRTVSVRVNVDNPEMRLKPGMFLHATVQARIDALGKIINTNMAGKWISPMHPEIIKDQPGPCDVCGMPLVKAEALGYSDTPAAHDLPLVIPDTAPLITGTRAIVYVRNPYSEKPEFEGREVVLGPHAGAFYVIYDGLDENDLVVTRGNFKLDAELQIRARPGMMSPDTRHPVSSVSTSAHKTVTEQSNPSLHTPLNNLLTQYLQIQTALAADRFEDASQYTRKTLDTLNGIDTSRLSPQEKTQWKEHASPLQRILTEMTAAESIEALRQSFALLSEQLTDTIHVLNPPHPGIYEFSCSMAFDNRGANWLQDHRQTANPYYGAAMLRCGILERELPANKKPETDHERH